MPRTVKVRKSVERTISTGNYENIRVSESIETDIEFNSASEMQAKLSALQSELLDQLEASVAATLERVKGRKAAPSPVSAMAKPAPAGAPAGLDEPWGDDAAEAYK